MGAGLRAHLSGAAHLFCCAGNLTESASVDQKIHEFFTELTEAGTYRLQVTTLSSSGPCEARESVRSPGSAFYLGASHRCADVGGQARCCCCMSAPSAGPRGELLEELHQRPRAVSVRLLDSSTAAVSWAPSAETHEGSLVSVVSTTCLRPSLGQRMERRYCREARTSTHETHARDACTGETAETNGPPPDDITGKLQQ